MAHFSHDDDVAYLQRKIYFIILLVALFFVIVLIRLFYLQVYRGNAFRTLSEQISVREEEIKAKRGLILDRNGRVLADSRAYFELVVVPQFLKNKKKTLEHLSRLLPISYEEMAQKIEKARGEPPFVPVVIAEDVPYDWVVKIREKERTEYDEDSFPNLEGVEIHSNSLRVYLYPELFSHALGYLKEIDPQTLSEFAEKYPARYSQSDLMGASGVERAYDLILRGYDGVKTRVVDAKGREVKGDPELELLESKTSIAPVQGYNLMTSLDFKAQEEAAKAMEGKRGAVVALEPATGETLVLYSAPGYNSNRIIRNIDKEYWKMINLHEDKYLFNRAIQATYPPGSIYKIVGAFAGLATEKITPKNSFNCGGGMKFGNRFFKCWNKGGHGSVNLFRGLSQSCDVFFYNVGLRVGVDTLKEYATLLGFGQKTGIEIAYEQGGLIPSSEWKSRRLKQPWIESETLSIVIGQGYDLVTPLQSAKMIAMVANGGHPITPHLGKAKTRPGEKPELINKPQEQKGVIPAEILARIQEGLYSVVHGGTANRLSQSPYSIAGKTGSAQVIGHDSGKAVTERTKAHGWFVAYAPFNNPKIAVAVIVENGGSGSGAAAPIAKAVIETYLEGRVPKDQVTKTKKK